MKLLIILALLVGSVFAQERPAIRKAKEALKAIKQAQSPCPFLQAELQPYCENKWTKAMEKRVDDLVKVALEDRVQEAVEKEEVKIQLEILAEKIKAWLDDNSVVYAPDATLKQLKALKKNKEDEIAEFNCVNELQLYFQQEGIPYNGNETCSELQFALEQYRVSQGSGSGSGQ
jgi:hypothetical protein